MKVMGIYIFFKLAAQMDKYLNIMKKKSFSYLLITAIIIVLAACKGGESLEKANETFALRQYYLAADMYKNVYSKAKDKNVKNEASFKMAECFRNYNDFEKAERQYDRTIKRKYNDPVAIFWLAEMKKRQEKYEEAIAEYNNYAKEMPGDPRTEIAIQSCKDAMQWKEEKTRYVVEESKILNSKENDFAPVYYQRGSIIITSDRTDSKGKIYGWNGLNHTDLYIAKMTKKRRAKRLLKPEPLDEDILNTAFNEGTVTLNKRQNVMYYTQCNDSKGKGTNCRILVSLRKAKGWSEPEVLPFCKDSFVMYGHPALSPDDKRLYFTSNMKGGQGGHDIWMSSFVQRGKTWGDPVNLGPVINTEGDEMFPFIYTDNKTLYFSSTGHPGMGGFDIFKSEKTTDGWTEPVNMKPPMNSGGDDFSIVVEPGGDKVKGYRGLFATNRPGTRGDDIYEFYMTPLKFTLAGTVFNIKTNEILPGAIVVLEVNDTLKLTTEADESGSYFFDLDRESDYIVSANKKYYFDSEPKTLSTIGLEVSEDFIRDLYLDPFLPKEIELVGIFYGLDSFNLRPESIPVLDSLYEILTNHPYVVIELASHTDCRATMEYNQTLSENRAKSVVDYLIYKGIPEDRLIPKGYGETQLANHCSCENGAGPGLDCTEEEHQQNRRTTFKIVATNYVYGEKFEPEKEKEEEYEEY
jgi:peptidoglycan-associated lipoprotein